MRTVSRSRALKIPLFSVRSDHPWSVVFQALMDIFQGCWTGLMHSERDGIFRLLRFFSPPRSDSIVLQIFVLRLDIKENNHFIHKINQASESLSDIPKATQFINDRILSGRYFQFSSVAQSCLTLCDPMNRSTPGLPVHHQLLEFTQTHVHRVGDAIQPSHPLSSPSPPAPNPSQHQGLFQWVNSSHEVAKVLASQLQHQSFQWTPRTDLL